MADEHAPTPTRILLAVNKSYKGYPLPAISSEHAFGWVLEKLIPKGCAQHYKLLILHVLVNDEDGFDDVDSVYATPDDFHAHKQAEKTRGKHFLEEFVRKCKEAEVPCRAWLKKGDPTEVINAEIRRVQPDLLVLGSRGLSTIQQMFVGSVSGHCFKTAECPILIVKRPPNLAPDDPLAD